jgi:hypothetical protein
MKGFLGIIAFLLTCAMIGAGNSEERRCLTWAFIVDIVGIVALYRIG